MTPENALRQLRDIHLPLAEGSVSALPVWLLPVCAATLTVLLWVWYKRRRALHWQHQTQSELDDISQVIANGDLQRGWQRLSIVLRQLALLHSAQTLSASCTGEQWLTVLNQLFDTDAFSGADGQLLLQAPYDVPSEIPDEPSRAALIRLIQLVRAALPSLDSVHAT